MDEITVHDKVFIPFISELRIREKVKEIAGRMNRDLKDLRPLFLAVLNGSFLFAADLFRELTIPAEICFIKLASYRGTTSSGHVVTAIGLDTEIRDRTVVILEDIVDTGKTMDGLLPQLSNRQPTRVLITALLTKPHALQYPIKVDYAGFEVPDKYLVGYGLDYDGLGRNLKDIYCVKE